MNKSRQGLLAVQPNVELNHSQRTTIIVVSHDRRVARATNRILTMRDGRIISDHPVADPLTEDLRELGQSRLGQRLIGADQSGQIPAVAVGQHQVKHQQIGALTPQGMQCSLAIVGAQDRIAGLFEIGSHQADDFMVIIDNQNSRHGNRRKMLRSDLIRALQFFQLGFQFGKQFAGDPLPGLFASPELEVP